MTDSHNPTLDEILHNFGWKFLKAFVSYQSESPAQQQHKTEAKQAIKALIADEVVKELEAQKQFINGLTVGGSNWHNAINWNIDKRIFELRKERDDNIYDERFR